MEVKSAQTTQRPRTSYRCTRGMREIQYPSLTSQFDLKISEAFLLLRKLEASARKVHDSGQTYNGGSFPRQLGTLALKVLKVLEEALPLAQDWCATAQIDLSAITRTVRCPKSHYIGTDIISSMLTYLNHTLWNGMPMEEYLEPLQIALIFMRLFDALDDGEIDGLSDRVFPGLKMLFGEPAHDFNIALCELETEEFLWCVPNHTKSLILSALQDRSWDALRDHLRGELDYARRPQHAVRVIYLLWMIESNLIYVRQILWN